MLIRDLRNITGVIALLLIPVPLFWGDWVASLLILIAEFLTLNS